MLAARLDYKINQGQLKIKKENIYCYTFGAIKVLTTEKNISKGYENIHNIYNYYDSFGPNGVNGYIGASSINAKFGHTILYKSKHAEKAIDIQVDDLQNSFITGGVTALYRTGKELKRALEECANHAIGSYLKDLNKRLVYRAANRMGLVLEDEEANEFKNLRLGDTVYFGKYEQDGNINNGREKIEWQVLEKKGNKALLISKKILDVQPYNKEYQDITWEKCTLRKWLNNEFIKVAFNAKESKKIQNSKIKNNKEYDVKSGKDTKDTKDKVFLLSVDESKKHFKTKKKRKAEITDYAIKRIAEVWGRTEEDIREQYFAEHNKNHNYSYWLRSLCNCHNKAVVVYYEGETYEDIGTMVCEDTQGVRPAIWVKLQQ